MTDRITFTGPYEVRERSAATVSLAFRQGSAAVVPTNVYYRVDDDGTGLVLADWTPVETPDSTNDVLITAEQNRNVRDSCDLERRTLSVMVDRGLPTQYVGSWTFAVRNLGWVC